MLYSLDYLLKLFPDCNSSWTFYALLIGMSDLTAISDELYDEPIRSMGSLRMVKSDKGDDQGL